MVDKYDFELDMISDNSNSLILREIKANSSILEFGPAHGRMTKYLKETLNCKISIVEIDEEAGKQASLFSELSFVGNEVGNIEKYIWLTELTNKNSKFDYIIFADVLEHLYDPWKVLSSVKPLLKDEGSVLISIPNVAHNSVIIDLLNNKFEYREFGLLDNTHIRFFTHKSLLEMVQRASFRVEKMLSARNAVENTEFKNSFSDVPPEVSKFLKKRSFGDMYQFVWILKKNA